jgi:hypothetical protein
MPGDNEFEALTDRRADGVVRLPLAKSEDSFALREPTSLDYTAGAAADVREQINRQVDTLCGDDLDSLFALKSILAGMIHIKTSKDKDG